MTTYKKLLHGEIVEIGGLEESRVKVKLSDSRKWVLVATGNDSIVLTPSSASSLADALTAAVKALREGTP